MKVQHTQGKWMLAIAGKNVHGTDTHQIISGIPYESAMGGDTETPICDIAQYGTDEEAKANAKLIAAAPELLEALKEVRKSLDEQYQTKDELIPPSIVYAYNKIAEVIEKATK